MNNVQITGRLVEGPRERATRGGARADFRLSVQHERGDGADLIPVVAYDDAAEAAMKYLTPGRHVAISGSLHMPETASRKGKRRIYAHVKARRIEMLDKPASNL